MRCFYFYSSYATGFQSIAFIILKKHKQFNLRKKASIPVINNMK